MFPKKLFLNEPPKEPYIFFGLHMQPETTIDVYAPFYSNQFAIIESISRSIPPTHALLVNDAAKKIKKAGVAQIVSTNTIPGESAKVDVSRVIADALK